MEIIANIISKENYVYMTCDSQSFTNKFYFRISHVCTYTI